MAQATPTGMVTYSVQAGDSPAIIAEKFTGNPNRTGELLAANRWKLRSFRSGQETFFSLREKELLRVPPQWRALSRVGLGDTTQSCATDSDCTDPNNPTCEIVSGSWTGDKPGTCGPTYSCNQPADTDDQSIIESATSCGAVYAQNVEHQITASQIWAAALKGMEQGVEDVIYVEGVIIAIEAMLANGILSGTLSAIFADLIDFLIGVCINLINEALATIGISAAVGADSLGPIGAIIGLVVGVIIAIFEVVFYKCTVQVTNGSSYDCNAYPQNIKNAIAWLAANANNLQGVTPKQLADRFGIFLANPIWLYNNQSVLGITQPSPPDPTDTAGPGELYFLPGAFELLNKAQLAAASSLVAMCPGKIPVWMYQPKQSVVPSQNLSDYQPLVDPTGMYRTWAPGVVSTNSASLTTITYTACPNLMVGTSSQDPFDKTSSVSYMLQTVFPSLTAQQCEAIFSHANTQAVYAANIAAARQWALSQCNDPTSELGTGGRFNLEKMDYQPIVDEWKATVQPNCQKQAAAAGAVVTTAAASVALAGAAGAGYLWWYAARNRTTFAGAYRQTTAAIARRFRGLRR